MTATRYRSYPDFRRRVSEAGWSMDQLRCNVPPTDDLLALMDRLGLDAYERFVRRLEREQERRRD